MLGMNDSSASQHQQYALALKVVDLAKAQLVADNHFLSSAIGQLRPAEAKLDTAKATTGGAPFATDARTLFVDPANLLSRFVEEGEPPTRDLLHTILHCVFLHPFVGANIRPDDWNLACDISCELVVAQVCGPRSGTRGADIDHALKRLALKVPESVTAEKVYAVLRDGALEDERASWRELFASDDHSPWYRGRAHGAGKAAEDKPEKDEDDLDQHDASSSREGHGVRGDDELSGGTPTDGGGNTEGKPAGDSPDPDARDSSDDPAATGTASHTPGEHTGNRSMFASAASTDAVTQTTRVQDEREAEQRWRKVAKSMSVDLRTISKKLGANLGELLQGLDQASRQTADYREFLRRFAVPTEVMKLSDDEFDTIFYTYGLSLYSNMPLVEPLEYRVDKRVREFVIAIDTSGSVYGDQVRDFVALTYDVLKSSETFDRRVKIKIVQCDTEVQHVDEVDSLDELRRWCGKMQVFGGGGTDFRPVFECVDAMLEQGELKDLGGLIYLTDGYGVYPSWVPGYKTAFVFGDKDHDESGVPPWAMRVTIDAAHMGGASWREIARG